MPSAEAVGRLTAYEVRLERQLFRAMGQLERLQRMRKGEDVKAPVVII